MAPSQKKEHKIPVRTVLELAPKTFWRPHSYRFQDSNTNNSTCSYQEPYRFSTTNTNYHKCSPQLSENIHELSEIQWNVMPPRGWATSLIHTLIATLAATLSPRSIRNRQFHERLSENDFDIFCILPNCA